LDLGKFITHIGAEVIEGYDGWNSNFSRSFLFGLAIPFTHTGLRASYDINDQLSVLGVIANGWDNTTDNNDSKSIGFQVAYSPSDDLSILFNWMGGNEQDDSDHEFRQIFDIVVDVAVSNQLSLQFNLDYGTEEDEGVGGGTAEWFGLAGIVRYDVNKWFSMNFRAEFFNDNDGVRTGTIGQDLWEITITPEFRINNNMVVRVEYRHDDSNRLTFDDGAGVSDSQDTIALNALVYF
jgi:predicted porin